MSELLGKKVSRRSLLRASVVAGAGLAALSVTPALAASQPAAARRLGSAQPKGTISFEWFDWRPARLLEEMGKVYQERTGWEVKATLGSADNWHDRIFTNFVGKTGADMPILDSQWIGEAVVGGHLYELTDWIKAGNIDIEDINPASLAGQGQYPQAKPGQTGTFDPNGRFYGVPLAGDSLGYVYRKDLFEDPKEKEAFKARYGYDLAPADTWAQYRDIAEFFTRPDQNLYGSALHYSASYDAIACIFNQLTWCFGGDIWDGTCKAEGYINGPGAVKALDLMKELYKFTPPGGGDWWFDELTTAMSQGQIAQMINWYAFHNALIDPKSSKVVDKVGFAVVPKAEQRVASIGGMGLHVSSYSKNIDQVLDFIKWVESAEGQMLWTKGGGFTARLSILNSPEYPTYYPWNEAYRQTVPLVRDFWNVPEYAKLLEIQNKTLHEAVVNNLDSKQALDEIARGQQQIFDDAGYCA